MSNIITDDQLQQLGFKIKELVRPDNESFSYREAVIETKHSHIEVINEYQDNQPVKQFLNLEIIEDGYRPVSLELLMELIPLIKKLEPVLENIPTHFELIKGH